MIDKQRVNDDMAGNIQNTFKQISQTKRSITALNMNKYNKSSAPQISEHCSRCENVSHLKSE